MRKFGFLRGIPRCTSVLTVVRFRSRTTGNTELPKEKPQRQNKRGGSLRPFFAFRLLRCEFLGLAFRTHEFERTLGLLVCLRDFLLHLGCGLFHLWREAHVAVIL